MLYLVFVQFGKYYAWIGLIISYGAAAEHIRSGDRAHILSLFAVVIIHAVTIATGDIARATAAKRIHNRYPTNTN
jgi:hypothetical protein